jgi:hypothetical protein
MCRRESLEVANLDKRLKYLTSDSTGPRFQSYQNLSKGLSGTAPKIISEKSQA